ncbi:MAG: hypothetical protein ACYC6Q_05620 [Syntrophales bacterium]
MSMTSTRNNNASIFVCFVDTFPGNPGTPPEGILLGEKINLTGVPTFIINEKFKIVGAQPLQAFQETFGRIGN